MFCFGGGGEAEKKMGMFMNEPKEEGPEMKCWILVTGALVLPFRATHYSLRLLGKIVLIHPLKKNLI